MPQYAKQTCHGRWMSQDCQAGLVSVIVPTYNRVGYVVETLNSVLVQNYRPIELIVVDDGSTDGTKEVVTDWQEANSHNRDFRIHYFFQENKGVEATRNKGMIESHGEFIQFLDSDDLLSPTKIANQLSILSSCKPGTAAYGDYCKFRLTDDGTIDIYETQTQHVPPNADFLELWFGYWVKNPHVYLFRRSDLYGMGPWDESLGSVGVEDVDYGTRFVLQGGSFVYCPQAWAFYRLYEGPADALSAVRTGQYWDSRIRVLDKTEETLIEKGTLEKYRSVLSLRYYGTAKESVHFSRDVMSSCLKKFRQLSPTGKLPGGFANRLGVKLLGLYLKEKLARYLRVKFGFHRNKIKPIASVENARQLYTGEFSLDPGHI